MNGRFFTLLLLLAGWAIAGILFMQRRAVTEAAVVTRPPPEPPRIIFKAHPPVSQVSVPQTDIGETPEPPLTTQSGSQLRSTIALSQLFSTTPPDNTTPLTDPVARVALSFVGIDADAEDVWEAAISDPNVPAAERANLIEDLNEDGFPDPQNITAEDTPLIVYRMNLIERLAPDAADETTAAAFEEAYKDLGEMLLKLGN